MSAEQEGATGAFKTAAARGVRWNLLESVIQQVARLTVMVAIARLIGPDEFGVVALATTYIVLIELLLDQGFGAALIQKKDLRSEDHAAALWFNLGAAAALGLLTVVLAPAVAGFFHTPELAAVLRVLTIGLLLRALSIVPASLLNRALRFRRLALANIASIAAAGAVGLWIAAQTGSYWAVVVQLLLQNLIFTAVVVPAVRLTPAAGSLAALRAMWRYSANVLGSRLVNYFGRNLDNILIGRYLGPGSLALYTMAYRAHLLPTHVLSRAVNKVAFPSFSRFQDDRPRVRTYFLFATRAMALVAFPGMALLIVTAPDLVRLVLGPEWMAAVVPMQILAFTAARQSVQTVAGPVFMGCGRADWEFRVTLAMLAARAAGFAIGLRWGIVGVATGYAVADLLFHPIVIRLVGRLVDLDLRSYLRELVPATWGALALVLAWKATEFGLAPVIPRVPLVAAASAVAGLAYLAVVHLVSPGALGTLSRTALEGMWRGRGTDRADRGQSPAPPTAPADDVQAAPEASRSPS